jgi:hypothetical protein
MKKLDRLKTLIKLLSLAGLILGEKKIIETILPQNPVLVRKLLIFAGTGIFLNLTIDLVFSCIDKNFNNIMSEVEKDAIGMVS